MASKRTDELQPGDIVMYDEEALAVQEVRDDRGGLPGKLILWQDQVVGTWADADAEWLLA